MARSTVTVAARGTSPGLLALAWMPAPIGWAPSGAALVGSRRHRSCSAGGYAVPLCCQEPRPPASSSPSPLAAATSAAAATAGAAAAAAAGAASASPAAPASPAATPPICVAGARTAGRVILLRHGQTDWNAAGRIQGQLDESRLTGAAALRTDLGPDGDAYRRFRADPEAYVHTDGVAAPLRDVRTRAMAAMRVLAAAAAAVRRRHGGMPATVTAGEDGQGSGGGGGSDGGGGGGGGADDTLPVVAAVSHNQVNRAALSAVVGGGTLATYTQANASFNVFVVDGVTGIVRLRAANSTRPLGAALLPARRPRGVVRLVVVVAATVPSDGGCGDAVDAAFGPPSPSPPPPPPALAATRDLLGASPVSRVVAPTAAAAAAAAAGVALPAASAPREAVKVDVDARLGALGGLAAPPPSEAVAVAAAVVDDVVVAATAAATPADGHLPASGGDRVDGGGGNDGGGGGGGGSGNGSSPVVLVVAPTATAAAAVVVAAAGLPAVSVTRLALDGGGVSVIDCGTATGAAVPPVVQCVNVGVGVGDTPLGEGRGDPGPVAPYVAALPGEG
ncbi:hypothetical protein MMPV_009659 [Pyropia vietnamensis]